LQRQYPGQFSEGQLRTLQRRLKHWRGIEGPGKEVFFSQKHVPGRLSQSDFTHMTSLGITIAGQSYPHLFFWGSKLKPHIFPNRIVFNRIGATC
jgi:hypothetical protein